MSIFQTYLEVGFNHISDWAAYDHMLFLLALTAVYQLHQWKDILVLVTAFTIGHSISLGLATSGVINMDQMFQLGETQFQLKQLIEFLIPLTILATALLNVIQKKEELGKGKMRVQYLIALVFGIIHGMGFSNLLKAMLGVEDSLVLPLFAFNVGIELGQLAIVAGIILLSWLIVRVFKAPQRSWNLFVSGAAAGVAWILLMNTKFW